MEDCTSLHIWLESQSVVVICLTRENFPVLFKLPSDFEISRVINAYTVDRVIIETVAAVVSRDHGWFLHNLFLKLEDLFHVGTMHGVRTR